MAGYIFCVLAFLTVVSAAVILFLYESNRSDMQKKADSAVIELWELDDGTYELNWSSLAELKADIYAVRVRTNTEAAVGAAEEKETFFEGIVRGDSCYLGRELPAGTSFVLEIDLFKESSTMGKENTRIASTKRDFSIMDRSPRITNLDWEVNSEDGTASIGLSYSDCNSCGIFIAEPDAERMLYKVVEENSLEVNMREELLWEPESGESCTLLLVPGYNKNNVIVYSNASREITFTWEDFAARDIHLSLDIVDECIGRLAWDKVDCDSYEIQMRNNDIGTWEAIKTVTGDDDCTYVTHRLSPGEGYSFRIAAVMGDYKAVSEVRECEIPVTPLYCTVWPVKDLTAYSDAAKSEVTGDVKLLDAHCIVAVEEDGAGHEMFGVDLGGTVGYIDSTFCMINLPEYVGGLCNYDITNSYESIFMAHGFEIPELTGKVIEGFEHVRIKEDSYLVPLLYPTAQKLVKAIDNAREKGYRLKIYEAFRPHEASVYMYKKASVIQYATLPENTYWGDDPGVDLYIDVVNENGEKTRRRRTYWELMNDENNSFNLSAFVSAGISKHNLGVAMDLTLESLDGEYEMPMQTALHDLSQYSARNKNNDYAKELSKIMLGADFGDLYSEWWHFQDNEIRSKYSLPCVDEGVTPECWMYNSFGWRYRSIDGTYAADCTLTIDGKEYIFDAEGYCYNYAQN